LVQLPGIDNPEHVKEILGKTAKMTFQLVDTNANVEEAKRVLPAGDEILPSADDARHPGGGGPSYVVQKRVMVSGDALTDARAPSRRRSRSSRSARSGPISAPIRFAPVRLRVSWAWLW